MDLEHKAIERLQEAARLSEFYYQAPLLLAYSGGKDSEVCLELCRRAGVPFEVVHNLTTADAPETIYHVKIRSAGWNWREFAVKFYLPAIKVSPFPCGR